MTMLWSADTTVIQRTRVKGVGLDSTLTQLRMANLMHAADIQPAGLAPSAIVCIRTLRAPRHMPLSLLHGGVRPPHAWEQSINTVLEEVIRHAARPILGPVPANSEAIVFNDTAELLACMTADWYEGLLPTRWWWKSLFKTSNVTSMLLPTWLDAPIYAPTALQHLAVRSLAIPFVRSLSDDNARLLLQKIIHTFSLPVLYQALYNSENATDPVMNQPAHRTTPRTANHQEATQAAAPWQHIVPEGEHNSLRTYSDQQCLLGIGLMLQRAPTKLRTQAFAQAVQHWQRAAHTAITNLGPTDETSAEKDGHPIIAGAGSTQDTIPTAPAFETTDKPIDEIPLETDERPIILGAGSTQGTIPTDPAFAPPDQPTDEALPETDEHPIIVGARQLQGAGSAQGTIPTAPAFAPTDALTDETPLEIHIDTAFGGLFYLINLALFLNLYSDFTSPMNEGIELPIWDFIALLGLELIGEAIKQDPIWPLLAQLAKRDVGDAPGKDFSPPDTWQIPAEWLELLDRDEEEWTAEKDFEHGEGPLQSWLNWLMPYIYARLQRALGLNTREQVAPLLCVHAARVRVTTTHLDVFFSLNTLPIEIRLAGLDRNPGWVPAAGRFIMFYFA